MKHEEITPDVIIEEIMLSLAKGRKPKEVVLCQELHEAFMYSKYYKLPALVARPEFFGLPCSVQPIDGFKIIT